ncbi:DUF1294 domain-containing protein [Bacillus sp. EB600]|uniref:DUF1294 domain-containing protein n=1 Tax=Bacillus sp. EB600 TaxID=2806345 RepID=UPI00210E5B6E|nr:DUF1294 domain-containing protein [Bacillus sp. EB600]MCQ6278328.1 DUF1294 domain-containing protein [Bacillus sp. EB600]
MDIKTTFVVCYLVMNLIGLFIMRDDKNRAIHHQYRISEKTLWITAFFGGAVGTTAGMKLFRHKTKHLSFKMGFPALAVIEIILFIVLLVKY